jgi:uncharacterized protein YbjT (DUF2867 family)
MILVTGATGFVGRNLVNRLVSAGERPRCLIRSRVKAQQTLPVQQVELALGDMTDISSLQAAMRGVTTVVHTAFVTANLKEGHGVSYYGVNVEGTRNLVAAARQAGVRRMIVVSGLGTKPDRPGTYMHGRYLAEQAVKESGLAWSIIQPSVQFGKGAEFINGLAALIRSAPVVPLIGGGNVRFQPIWVEDVARCVEQMIRNEAMDGRAYAVGGPDILTYTQIVDLLMDTMHVYRPKVPVPVAMVSLGALAMQMVLPRPPITTAALMLFSFDNITDLDSVERIFGFTPMALPAYLAQYGVDSFSAR